MDILDFSQQKTLLSHRISNLQPYIAQGVNPSPEVLLSSLEDLQVALEELQIAEEELHQQNEELLAANITIETERLRYQELFEFAPECYLVTDTYGIIRAANQAAEDLLGLSARHLWGKPLVNFVDLNARATFRTQLSRLMQADTALEWEMTMRSRQDCVFPVALKAAVVRHGQEEDEATTLRWIIRDITAQKEAEAQLQALNAQLLQRRSLDETVKHIGDRLRDSLDESQIIHITLRELVLALNLMACDIGIYDLKNHRSLIYPSFTLAETSPSEPGAIAMESFSKGYRQLLQRQEFQFCERTDHPARSRLSILACPIVDCQEILGDIWCFSPCDRSLTSDQVYLVRQVANQCAIALRQARLYQEAQNHVEQLKKLNWLKTDFLNTVSHELRTPLTNIKMSLYVMQIAKSDEQRERCYQIVKDECDREINLITDLLDLQYLEAGSYSELILDSIDIYSWVPQMLKPLDKLFAARAQPVHVAIAPRIPHLMSDRKSLGRVVQELLKNAHKHTPQGGEVRLEVQFDRKGDRLLIMLQNQAEIPPAELPHIFEKFYRSPTLNPTFVDGTGLGLPLAKRLVDYLQGTITVTSGDGWTTVLLNLPIHLKRTR